jgi:hypothetical protein
MLGYKVEDKLYVVVREQKGLIPLPVVFSLDNVPQWVPEDILGGMRKHLTGYIKLSTKYYFV